MRYSIVERRIFLLFVLNCQQIVLPLASPKVLSFGKTQIYLVFLSLIRTFALKHHFREYEE